MKKKLVDALVNVARSVCEKRRWDWYQLGSFGRVHHPQVQSISAIYDAMLMCERRALVRSLSLMYGNGYATMYMDSLNPKV